MKSRLSIFNFKTLSVSVRLSPAILLCAVLVLPLVTVELAIRFFAPEFDPGRQLVFSKLEGYNGATIAPLNTTVRQRTPRGDYDLQVSFNRYGLRDNKDLAESVPEDILLVGDSHCMGWGVETEERFSELLEDLLDTHVFNAAVPANLRQYIGLLAYAEDHGVAFTNILVGIGMDDDILNYAESAATAESKPEKRLNWKDRLRVELRLRSSIYLALSWNLHTRPDLRNKLLKLGIARSNPSQARDIFELALRHTYDEQAIDASVQVAQEIEEAVGQGHVLFVIIPSITLWMGENGETISRIHDTFVTRMKAAGLPILDLLPYFEAQENPLDFYFKTDPHWNREGHILAARAIAEELSARKQ